MIFRTIEDIPYPFLHDAIFLMDKYTKGFKSVYMDPKGECAITLKGLLEDKHTLQRIMGDLDPYITSETLFSDYNPEMFLDYSWSSDYTETYIYTKKGIDYRKI